MNDPSTPAAYLGENSLRNAVYTDAYKAMMARQMQAASPPDYSSNLLANAYHHPKPGPGELIAEPAPKALYLRVWRWLMRGRMRTRS